MRIKPMPVLIVLCVVAVAAYGGTRVFGRDEAKQAPPSPAIPVTVVGAKLDDLPIYLRGIGTVQALNAVEIHPQVGGVLTNLPVQEGQEVRKGDVVAVIDPRPLKAALDKAEAQRVQDQAQLVNAQADQQRYATLATRDFASRQQLETQQSTVARLQGVVAADDASIQEAQINLGYAVVHAPIDGRISLRRVDPGNLIQANATGPGIVSIQQVRPISVVFTLPESDVQRVRDAMAKGTLAVLADSSDMTKELARGTLATPDNAINTTTGTMQFRAVFENAEERLTPGQFVSTRLQVGIAHGVTIPHVAVQHSQDGLFVYVVKPDKTAERQTVVIAYDDGHNAVVKEGVADAQQVVNTGQSRVGPGTKLAFKADGSADTPDGAKPDGSKPGGGTADQSASR